MSDVMAVGLLHFEPGRCRATIARRLPGARLCAAFAGVCRQSFGAGAFRRLDSCATCAAWAPTCGGIHQRVYPLVSWSERNGRPRRSGFAVAPHQDARCRTRAPHPVVPRTNFSVWARKCPCYRGCPAMWSERTSGSSDRPADWYEKSYSLIHVPFRENRDCRWQPQPGRSAFRLSGCASIRSALPNGVSASGPIGLRCGVDRRSR